VKNAYGHQLVFITRFLLKFVRDICFIDWFRISTQHSLHLYLKIYAIIW